MTVFITAVKVSAAGSGHEHIVEIRWLNCNDSTSNTMSTASAVEYIQAKSTLHVAGPDGAIGVGVVDATPPYLRTIANGKYTDNLLALPRY